MVITEKNDLIERCYRAGLKNGWASGRYAIQDGDFIVENDRLNRNSISVIETMKELEKWFKDGNLCLGTGFIFKNLFFLQQVDGGDEWATYKITDKTIFQFESISFKRIIETDGKEEFKKLMARLLNATDEQLKKLAY